MGISKELSVHLPHLLLKPLWNCMDRDGLMQKMSTLENDVCCGRINGKEMMNKPDAGQWACPRLTQNISN